MKSSVTAGNMKKSKLGLKNHGNIQTLQFHLQEYCSKGFGNQSHVALKKPS
jgi:hypothetical protein